MSDTSGEFNADQRRRASPVGCSISIEPCRIQSGDRLWPPYLARPSGRREPFGFQRSRLPPASRLDRISIIGIQIKDELGLNETQFGLLVGTPILTGSLIRIVLGVWADTIRWPRIFALVMLAAAIATWLLTYAKTYPQMLVAALGVGIAGGAFAVGVAYVSHWYPPEKQGTALGIFGAGNVGAAVTKFLAPFVLVAYGWESVAQIWAVALALIGIIFWFSTSEDPVQRARAVSGKKPKSAWLELAPLKNVQVWRFGCTTFLSSAPS